MNPGRPSWTSSLVGVVPALRKLSTDGVALREIDRALMNALAEDLQDDVAHLKSVAQFRPQSLETEAPSPLRRAVATAVAELGQPSGTSTSEETTRLLDELQGQLRRIAADQATAAELDHVLAVLDRASDHVFGAQPSTAA